jgi:membrane-associated protease RseP (regulator of RpoE activity)
MAETTLGFPVSPLAFVVILCLVTVVHELGHLFVARLVHVPVRQISVGFGPVLWRWSVGEASFLIFRALPVGMAIGVPGRYTPEGELRRPIHYDLLIAAGGPLASFAFSAILLILCRFLPLSSLVDVWLIAAAILSTLVALLNLLPLPGLDGGHLALLTAIRLGLRLSPAQEMRLQRLGLRLLLAFCTIGTVALYGMAHLSRYFSQ